MLSDDCSARTQRPSPCCMYLLKSFVFKAIPVLPKILYHKRDSLSIRYRLRWRGAACYTSHDLRVFLTNAAHLLALLRCPEFSAEDGASLKIQTAAPRDILSGESEKVHIKAKPCISSTRSVVYHPQLVAVYHQAAGECTLRVMRYKGAKRPR